MECEGMAQKEKSIHFDWLQVSFHTVSTIVDN